MLLAPDTLVEDYRIIRRLGSGGMADVYEAEELALRRHVALKVLSRSQTMQSDAIVRFQRESRVVASLNHRGIVQIYKVGNDPALGLLFYSMRLLQGGDLAAAIRRGLTRRMVLTVLKELAEAFSHAHAHGLVHRDVKPGNVMFDDRGFPVITDFGIAKLRDQTQLTVTGMAMGTPTYISPEQASGVPVDARSDLYSLGVMLYEMLCGRPPYEAEHVTGVIFKHLTDPVPRLPPAHADLQPLLDVLMAKAREQRVPNAAALAERVQPFLELAGGAEWVRVPEHRDSQHAGDPTPRFAAVGAAPDAPTLMTETPALAAVTAPVIGAAGTARERVEPGARPSRSRRGAAVGGAALAIAAILTAGYWFWPQAPEPGDGTGASSLPATSTVPVNASAPEPQTLPATNQASVQAPAVATPPVQPEPTASAPAATDLATPSKRVVARARPRVEAAPSARSESTEALPRQEPAPAPDPVPAPAVGASEAVTPSSPAPATVSVTQAETPPPAAGIAEPKPAAEPLAPAQDEAEQKRKDRARRSSGF